jgi:8-oxo-dGTP diphosphatase
MKRADRDPHRDVALPSSRPELGSNAASDADPTRSLVSVGWIHIRGRRLLGVRSKTSNRFYLPGGKPEAGETLEEALEREIREELAIGLVHIQFLYTVSAPAYGLVPPVGLTMHCYRGDPRGRLQPSREIAELAWLGMGDARAAPALGAVLARMGSAGLIT